MSSNPIEPQQGWRRWLWPLLSRKVQVAVATIVVAYGAKVGVVLDESQITSVIAIGAALILGIAHEDSGAKSAG